MDMDKELNCSEGARMLIERMQTHPDDFKPQGRFYWIAEKLRGVSPKGQNELSERDWHALQDAFDKAVLEPWLTETVVDEIFNGDKRREEEQAQVSAQYTARLAASMTATKNQMAASMLAGSGFNDPRLLYGNAISNPAQGQVLWDSAATASLRNKNKEELTLWQRINQQLKQLKKSATA